MLKICHIFFLTKFVVISGSGFETVLKCDLHYKFPYPVHVFYFSNLFIQCLGISHVIGQGKDPCA